MSLTHTTRDALSEMHTLAPAGSPPRPEVGCFSEMYFACTTSALQLGQHMPPPQVLVRLLRFVKPVGFSREDLRIRPKSKRNGSYVKKGGADAWALCNSRNFGIEDVPLRNA